MTKDRFHCEVQKLSSSEKLVENWPDLGICGCDRATWERRGGEVGDAARREKAEEELLVGSH